VATSYRTFCFSAMNLQYQVYVLKNLTDRLYIGVTKSVAIRVTQHNAGSSKWTSKYRPWDLIWTSQSMSLGDARRLENVMKRQKGGDGLNTLMKEYAS
jgi:putative endonuclease